MRSNDIFGSLGCGSVRSSIQTAKVSVDKDLQFYGPSSIQVARSLLISASEWTELSDSIVFSKQERFFPPDI